MLREAGAMHDLEGLRLEITRCRREIEDTADWSRKDELARRLENLSLFSVYFEKAAPQTVR
jgi:hypothetical protein